MSNAPPEPKTPWDHIVIPPHALRMTMIRASYKSIVDASILIERLYPMAQYKFSQKTAQGTSHTKRATPRNKRKNCRVDVYVVEDKGIEWQFFMRKNVMLTVHRADDGYGGVQ